MESFGLKASLILVAILLLADCLNVEGQICRPSGTIRGKKPPPGECNQDNDSDCCCWTWAGSPTWARLNPTQKPKEVEAVVLETTANDKEQRVSFLNIFL